MGEEYIFSQMVPIMRVCLEMIWQMPMVLIFQKILYIKESSSKILFKEKECRKVLIIVTTDFI